MSPLRFQSINPANGEPVWSGIASSPEAVASAVERAERAFVSWAAESLQAREGILRSFARVLQDRREALASMISLEVGKPYWEALTEVQSMVGKIDLAIAAHARRCAEFRGGPAITRFRPHGVVAVFGPFNFPGHLPNGHIAPALLAGNTVLFKPSEAAPAVAEAVRDCWRKAGLPEDVLIVLQGPGSVGSKIVEHPGVKGIFFTGGSAAGRAIESASQRFPGRIVALEMGGNNPLVIWPPADPAVAAAIAAQSAFISAGQRCTCARRLIVPQGRDGDEILGRLVAIAGALRVGNPSDRPEPFMGPLVSRGAAEKVLQAQAALVAAGGRLLLPARGQGHAQVTPGVIDVSEIANRRDAEVFGPLLQVVRVATFEAALAECNATEFGLAAGLLCDDVELYSKFRYTVRAGVINWNQPLTGASGAAPFGGVGASGNHRPSGYFAADYCAFPVASIESEHLELPKNPMPGFPASP